MVILSTENILGYDPLQKLEIFLSKKSFFLMEYIIDVFDIHINLVRSVLYKKRWVKTITVPLQNTITKCIDSP